MTKAELKWMNEFNFYQWNVLNQVVRVSNKDYILKQLREMQFAADPEEPDWVASEMETLKSDVQDMIQKIERMSQNEVDEVFLLLPVDPSSGLSLHA